MKFLRIALFSLLSLLNTLEVSAQASNKGNNIPLYSASLNFTNLSNSQYDSSFNEKIFIELVRSALNDAGISVSENKRGKYHLFFDADYVYHVGNVDYRFVTIRISSRNKEGQALCDVSLSSWWGGPSGAAQMINTFNNVNNGFFKNCIK